MCDAECQAEFLANAKEEAAEAENVIFLVTFFLLVGLVYVTGLIVWVWCNRSPPEGLMQNNSGLKSSQLWGNSNQSNSCASQYLRPSGEQGLNGLNGGILLLLGALIQQQCQEKSRQSQESHPKLAVSEDIEELEEVIVHSLS